MELIKEKPKTTSHYWGYRELEAHELAIVGGGLNFGPNAPQSTNVESCDVSGPGCVSVGDIGGFSGCSTGVGSCSCDGVGDTGDTGDTGDSGGDGGDGGDGGG